MDINVLSEEFRNLHKQLQSLETQQNQLKHEIKAVDHHKQGVLKEIKNLKILIDYCTLTGEDSIQAKLSHTIQEMEHYVTEQMQKLQLDMPYFHITTSIQYGTILSSPNTIITNNTSSVTASGLASTIVTNSVV